MACYSFLASAVASVVMAPKRQGCKRGPSKSNRHKQGEAADTVHPRLKGPTSLEDFYRWPQVVLERLVNRGDSSDGLRRARLELLLSKRMLTTSDYSGLSGESEILHQMDPVLRSILDLPRDQLFHHSKYCDHGKLQQAALQALCVSEPNCCVFQDLADRLGPVAARYVEAMRPAEGSSVAEAGAAYKEMAAWLMDNRKDLLKVDHTSYCVAHDKMCEVSAPILPASEEETEERQPDSMLKVHFAGTTCRGWSSAGQQRFWGDKSEEPHGIWLAHRRLEAERTDGGAEDIVISECTVRYPAKALLFIAVDLGAVCSVFTC